MSITSYSFPLTHIKEQTSTRSAFANHYSSTLIISTKFKQLCSKSHRFLFLFILKIFFKWNSNIKVSTKKKEIIHWFLKDFSSQTISLLFLFFVRSIQSINWNRNKHQRYIKLERAFCVCMLHKKKCKAFITMCFFDDKLLNQNNFLLLCALLLMNFLY